jgi:putative transposase
LANGTNDLGELYEVEGGVALRLGYRGSESYLEDGQRQAILAWIEARETVSVEALRDYIEEQYGVVYRSKQSSYELLDAGGMSYHRSERLSGNGYAAAS